VLAWLKAAFHFARGIRFCLRPCALGLGAAVALGKVSLGADMPN
jgi:hypothetical protein